MDAEYEVRKTSSRKGRWESGHTYSRLNWGCQVLEQICLESDQKSVLHFVSEYLEDHKEMAHWNSTGHLNYTLNKRKRWMITKRIKNVFKEDLENLEQEPYGVVVVERDVNETYADRQRPKLAVNAFDSRNLPIPNKKNCQKLRGKPLAPIREGKSNGKTHLESLIDVPSLSKTSPPQLVYQAWEVQPKTKHIVRGDKSIYCYTPWKRSYCQPISSREKKKSSSCFARECIEGGIDEYIYDAYSISIMAHVRKHCRCNYDGDEIIVNVDGEIDANDNIKYDFKETPMTVSLHDIIKRKNNSLKRTHQNKVTANSNINSKKGKNVYDPNFVSNETSNSFEEHGEEQNNKYFEKENWLEKLEEDAKIIVFLDVSDVLLSVPEGWRRFGGRTDTHRVMLEHLEGGVVILIEVRQSEDYGSAECALTVMNLSGEAFADILDVFSNMSSIQEMANAAVSLCSTIKKNDYLETDDYVIVKESLAHLSMKQSPVPPTFSLLPTPSSDCGICFSHPDEGASLSCLMECGHSFCSTCWQHYLASQVRNGQSLLSCPAYLCDSPVDLPTTAWYLGVDHYKLFLRLVVSSQVSSDKRYIWCPKPACGRVVFLNNPDVDHIKCLCNSQWCLRCKEGQHWPASCKDKADFKAYQFKMEEYQQLESSVMVRSCPKCHTFWEKMYGCNHMACTCGAHFCWGCGQEHVGSMGNACGGIKVPLESVNIVPLPREKFSMRRIKAFQMAEKLNKRTAFVSGSTTRNLEMFCGNFSGQDKDTEVLVHKFLSVDRKEYFESLGKGILCFQKSSEYRRTKDVIWKATAVAKQGQVILANAYLMPQSSNNTNNARINALVGTLEDLSVVLHQSKLTKNNIEKQMEKIKKMTEEINRGLIRYKKLR